MKGADVTGHLQVLRNHSDHPARLALARLEFFLAAGAVFFAPMNIVRLPGVYFTLSDGFALACLCLMSATGSLPFRPLGSTTVIWLLGITLLNLGLLISSVAHGVTGRGIIIAGQYTFAYFALPFMLMNRPRDQLATLIKLFVLCIFLTCLHGIYAVNIAHERYTLFVSPTGRFLSFVERENEAGALFAITLPLLLWLFEAGHISRLSTIVGFAVISYGVLLTGSNTATLATGYALAMFFITTLTFKRAVWTLTTIVTGLLVVGFFGDMLLPDVFRHRVLSAIESGDIDEAGTFLGRVDLINGAVNVINKSPFVGVGADQFAETNYLNQPVHNTYLLLWAEGGFLALLGFVLVLLSFFSAASVALKERLGWLSAVCTFSVVTLFAFMVNAFAHVYGRFWVVPLLLSVGLSLSLGRAESEPSPRMQASKV